MNMYLQEKLDFSFSEEDFNSVDELFQYYIIERKNVFETLFKNINYSKEEKIDYINFFIMKLDKEEEQHPSIHHIIHFLNRKYEFFTLPEIDKLIQSLKKFFVVDEDYDLSEEIKNISQLALTWEKLKRLVKQYPKLDIQNFSKEEVGRCILYYKNDTDEFVLEAVETFLQKISKVFPHQVSRIDSFILCSPEYISFSGGKNTFAFYIEDSVFLKNKIEDKDKKFYIETQYHEFGHFLFELLSQKNQIKWYNLYDSWEEKKITMSREDGNNDPEELFADAFSIIMTDVHDYLNPNVNPIILKYTKLFLEDEFKVYL